LHFFDNGYYRIDHEILLEPPSYNKKVLFHIYNSNLALLKKLSKNISLSFREHQDLENLPSTFMICYLNGFDEAKQQLIDAKPLLKAQSNPLVYLAFKEAMRILRKMKYDVS
jgi:adenine specific DNA methylase Mod